MAGFFQPGPSQADTTTSTTLSPAQQALQKFRLEMLGRLLNSSAGNGPTFKSFVNGGPASRPVPSGLGDGSAAVLQAMNQPGAFTTTATGSKTEQGGTPSILSDLTQLGLLGALVAKSGLLDGLGGGIGDWLKTKYGDTGAVSGASGMFGNEPPMANANVPAIQNQDNLFNALGGMFGADNQIPMASAGQSDQDFLQALMNLY